MQLCKTLGVHESSQTEKILQILVFPRAASPLHTSVSHNFKTKQKNKPIALKKFSKDLNSVFE